jgi:hypothetical protein
MGGYVMKRIILTLVLSASYLLSGTAQAVPVLWTLSGVEFDDGGTASGSFVYDDDCRTGVNSSCDGWSSYTNFSIETTAGSALPGQTYEVDITELFQGLMLSATPSPRPEDLIGAPTFLLRFGTPSNSLMGNSGGTKSIYMPFSGEGYCAVLGVVPATCYPIEGEALVREIIAGSVIGTVVPIPAAVYLFASGLGLLGWFRRKS